LVLFLVCLGRVWTAHSWMQDLKPFLVSLLGLVTGHYGWTRAVWREHPAALVKWGGAAMLVFSAIRILS
jgi:hypothetical protein